MALYDFFLGFLLPAEAVAIAILLLAGSGLLIEEATKNRKKAQPASTAVDAIEGVTMPSILFAKSSEDDNRERHTLFELVTIPPIGMDMPRAMMAGYDTPVAVPKALQQDITRLLAELEARL